MATKKVDEKAKKPAAAPAAKKAPAPAAASAKSGAPKKQEEEDLIPAEKLLEMAKKGEIPVEYTDQFPTTFTQENLEKFIVGEITWAELEGMSMEEAYAIADLGYTLFEQGRYDDAQTVYEGLVIGNPYDAYFHTMLGAIYAKKNMHEEAAEEYSIAIELDPKNISAYVNRGELLLQHGEFEYAMDDLKAAIDLDPKAENPSGIRARALAAATAAIIKEVLEKKGKAGGAPAAKPAAGAKPAPAKPAPARK
ncbi:MAG: tetratricopeptide repeat protein [Myxococcota bacterium]